MSRKVGEKKVNTLKSGIGLYPTQGLFTFVAFHLLPFQFFNLQIQFLTLMNDQEIPDKKKFIVSNNFI